MPPALITSPTPIPGRRGLLSVAVAPGDIPAQWLQGVTFGPESCAAPLPLPWAMCDETPDLDDQTDRPDAAVWQPILLRGVDECSTLDGFRTAEREARARSNLTVTASFQAEQEFSDAVASDEAGDLNPHLTAAAGWVTATTVTGGADSPADALALLEQGMAECLHGQRGVIHATPGVVTKWSENGLVTLQGASLVTANDNLVVAGAGYSGDGPTGTAHAAGQAWVYGTGLVYQIRGAVTTEGEPFERVDRAQNSVVTWVTQPLLVYTSPCCKLAAQITVVS